jgi:hypothetical protein
MRPHTERKYKHMRTKTLLLTAALSAAGLVSSQAQVLSVNSVGYVNQTVPAGTAGPAPGQGGAPTANRLSILSIPLNGMDGGAINNNVTNTVKPPDPGSDGSVIYRFDVPTQNYLEAIQYFDGFGWFSPSPNPNDMIINPGEGFWLSNPNPIAMPLVFTGEVPMGAALPNAVPGNPRLKLTSSVVPIGSPLGGTDQAVHGNPRQTLYFPALDGDIAYIWDVAAQNYKEAYQYFGGFGWFSPNPDDPGPNGPVIAVGTGFWIQKGQNALGVPNPAATWNQSYSVADGYNYNL